MTTTLQAAESAAQPTNQPTDQSTNSGKPTSALLQDILRQIASLPDDGQAALVSMLPYDLAAKAKNVTMVSELVNPEKAKRYLSYNNYDLQRRMSDPNVQFLANEMVDGRWRLNSEVALSNYDGQTFVTNGQNRLEAVYRSGMTQQFLVKRTQCKTLQELRDSYLVEDGGKPRSQQDRLKALTYGESMILDLSERSLLMAAIRGMMSGFGETSIRLRRKVSDTQLIPNLMTLQGAAKFYLETIDVSPSKKRLRGAAALAIGVLGFHFKPEAAEPFWKIVADPEAGSENSPARRLREFFDSYTSDQLGVRRYARVIAWAYNKYVNKESIKEPLTPDVVADETAPFKLNGTPFDGKDIRVLTLDGVVAKLSELPEPRKFPKIKEPKPLKVAKGRGKVPEARQTTLEEFIDGNEPSANGNHASANGNHASANGLSASTNGLSAEVQEASVAEADANAVIATAANVDDSQPQETGDSQPQEAVSA